MNMLGVPKYTINKRRTSRPKGNPTKPTPSKDHFERLLDVPCPHHEVPIKHTLRE
jgi:hypothetical protein